MSDLDKKMAELTAQNNEYDLVVKVIEFLCSHHFDQPSLFDLSDHVGMSSGHIQKVFSKWAGISPKDFKDYLTIHHARKMLQEKESILNTSYDLGLSSPGRLHDLFTKVEAMPPGVYKSGGEGIDIYYGYQDGPFGRTIIMQTKGLNGKMGICGIGFVDGDDEAALKDLTDRWPHANYILDNDLIAKNSSPIFEPDKWSVEKPISLILIGSDFDVKIWRCLLKIPMGKAVSYGDIALDLGKAKGASRAVGSSVGRNPISFLIPCHRVLRANGEMGGYHWGISRKRAIIGWEACQLTQ